MLYEKPRRSLTLLAFLLLSSGQSIAAEAVSQDLLRDCAAVRDANARLACFEALVEDPAPAEAAPAPTPAPAPAPRVSSPRPAPPATVSEARAAEDDDFGLEHKNIPEPAMAQEDREPDIRRLRVTSAAHNDFTGWTIEFGNGQVWKQIGTEPYDIEEGATYSIQRGSFNSYLLGNPDNNRKIRVTRVR